MTNIITAAVRGEAGGKSFILSARVTANAIEDIRKHFSGTTIQRMLRSVDYAGHQISGLKPFIEHILKIQLYPYEMELQEKLAQELIRGGTCKASELYSGGSVSISNFIPHLGKPNHYFYSGILLEFAASTCPSKPQS